MTKEGMVNVIKPGKAKPGRKPGQNSPYRRIDELTEAQRMTLHTMFYEGRSLSYILT